MVLVVSYLLHTTGELCLSPVGLSEITKLAPAVLVSTLMAVWFLAISAAEFIAASIASLAGTATAGGQVLDPAAALHTSLHMFSAIGWAGVGFGAALPRPRARSSGAGHMASTSLAAATPSPNRLPRPSTAELQGVSPATLRAER